MAWIESHQSLSRHGKTLRVVELLRVDRHKLIGHLHELWWWGLDNADIHGHIRHATVQTIAEAAGWPAKQAQQFVGALVDAGFLDELADGYALHDWYDYAGKLNEQREKDRERMRVRRTSGEQRREKRSASGGRSPDVRRMSGGTGPDPTGPDPTGPDTPPNPPGGAAPAIVSTTPIQPNGTAHLEAWATAMHRKPRDATSDDRTAAATLAAQERDPELIAEVVAWMGCSSYHGDPARLKSVEKNWAKFLAERDANACRCGSNGVAPPAALPLSQHERLRRGIAHV